MALPQGLALGLLALLCLARASAQDSRDGELGRVSEFQTELQQREGQGPKGKPAAGAPRDDTMSALGASAAAAIGAAGALPQACLEAAMARAEATYQRHVARRRASLGGREGADTPAVADTEELIEKLLVPTYPCVLEQRAGLGGEGGKWICRGTLRMRGAPSGPPSVVSVGSHGRTDFEEDMHGLFGSVSNTFDPFLPRPMREVVDKHPFMRLHSVGLLGSGQLAAWEARPGNTQRMVTLQGLLKEIGKESVDVFKIDCEGCEVGVAKDLERMGRGGQRVGQIQMEVHKLNNVPQATALLARLEGAGYRMFHAETNPYAFPPCYEIALIHESQLARAAGAPAAQDAAAEAACYAALAAAADAVFAANWARKGKPYRDAGKPGIPRLKWQDVVLVLLVADYPCLLQERFGVWGKGGAWVCLSHKPRCPAKATGTPVVVTVGGNGTEAGSAALKLETELAAAFGATAHVFNPFLDPAVSAVGGGAEAPTVVYHRMAVAGAGEVQKRVGQLNTKHIDIIGVLEQVGSSSVQILRIDCGGCEFGIVEDLATKFTRNGVPFGQIAVTVYNHRKTQGMLSSLHGLGYRIFHAEEVGRREPVQSFEISLIHEGCL